jgi:hypothetical protein
VHPQFLLEQQEKEESMYRITLLLSIIAFAGCANTAPRLSPEEYLDQLSQAQVNLVLSSCKATNQNYVDGQSPVDCVVDYPNLLTMSFPNRELYMEHKKGMIVFFKRWCDGVQVREGIFPSIDLTLRSEGKTFNHSCEQFTRNEGE